MSEVSGQDPLSILVASAADLDRKLLASILEPYARIDPNNGEPRFLAPIRTLTQGQRIIVALLAHKAARALGLMEREGLSPMEIAKLTGIRGGSVRRELVELTRKGLIVRERGIYHVPNYALQVVQEYLRGTS